MQAVCAHLSILQQCASCAAARERDIRVASRIYVGVMRLPSFSSARPATSHGSSTNASATPLTAAAHNAAAGNAGTAPTPDLKDGELGDVLHDLNGRFASAAKDEKDDPAMCTI